MQIDSVRTLGYMPVVFSGVIVVANIILPKLLHLTGAKLPEQEDYYKDWKFHMDVVINSGIANAIFATANLAYEILKKRLQENNLDNINIPEMLQKEGKIRGISVIVFSSFVEASILLQHLIPDNTLALTASMVLLSLLAAECFKGLTKLAGVEMSLPLLFQFAGGMYTSAIINATHISKFISDNLNIERALIGGSTAAAVFFEGLVSLYGSSILTTAGTFAKNVGSKIYGYFFANPLPENPPLLDTEQTEYDTLSTPSRSSSRLEG